MAKLTSPFTVKLLRMQKGNTSVCIIFFFSREREVLLLETIINNIGPVTQISYFSFQYTVRHISCQFLFNKS